MMIIDVGCNDRLLGTSRESFPDARNQRFISRRNSLAREWNSKYTNVELQNNVQL